MPREANSEFLGDPDEHSIAILSSSIVNDNPGPSRFTEGDMKITKRLSIEFQHREITIAVSNATLHARDDEPGAGNVPVICPACGSPWITVAVDAGEDAAASASSIHRALQQCGLHLHVSAAGQLRICRRSFEEIKEKL